MKKQLFWMFGAALALTSCSNDEQVAVNPANEITFRTAVTRATTSDIYGNDEGNAQLKTTGFYVDAYIVENEGSSTSDHHHIQNEKYTYQDDAYKKEGGDAHYWTINEKYIVGQAWASSYEDIMSVTSTDKASYTYNVTVNTNIAQQKDFITAGICKSKDNAITSGIPLEFEHRLTQVGIRVNNNSEYKIEIAGAKLGNVYTGNGTLTASATINESGNPTATWKYEFSNLTTKGSYEVIYNTNTVTMGKDESKALPDTNALGANAFFMLYPQTITTWDKSTTISDDYTEGAYIALLAKMTHEESGSYGDFPFYPNAEQKDKTYTDYGWVYVPVPAVTWEANKCYVYTLTFTNTALGYTKEGSSIGTTGQKDEGVSFSEVTVGPWETPETWDGELVK